MMNSIYYFLIALTIIVGSVQVMAQSFVCHSPDGKLKSVLTLDKAGQISYCLLLDDDTVLRPSSLGLVLKSGVEFSQFKSINEKRKSIRDQWTPVWGISSLINNHYEEAIYSLEGVSTPLLEVCFRVYNDGFAFRYQLNGDAKDSVVLMQEKSEFCFTDIETCWWSWADYNTLEKEYYQTNIDSASHVACPFTLRTKKGLYLCIHEAAIDRYSTMTLKQDKHDKGKFSVNLVPWADGSAVKTNFPLISPWRAVFIAPQAGDLLETHFLENLNDPCVLQDVSFIKPMTYVGIWWEMHLGLSTWGLNGKHGANTENAKRYIDFAAQNNIGGFLVEGWNTGWERWGEKNAFDYISSYQDFNLEEIATYAKKKGVQMIGHHETGGDIISYEQHLDSAFALYQRLGIHAVKTGYAGPVNPPTEYHHGQYMVEHYNKVMRKAAQYGLMLDVHEPVILSGLSRTYPNLMTAEGVRGMEWNAWSQGNPPKHTCTLPFTRGMAGPMDYTPGIFDIDLNSHAAERKKWNSLDQGTSAVHSTISNQLALMIILYSPLQMAADLPENYDQHPALELIKGMPASWDETHALEAEIGQWIVLARRQGKNWYVAGICNEEGKELTLNFAFLNSQKNYKAIGVFDNDKSHYATHPEEYQIINEVLTETSRKKIKMAAGGGFIIRLTEMQ